MTIGLCTSARVGDSSALILRDGRTWQSLKGGKSDGGAIATSRTAALPMVSREPPQPTSALLGRDDVLVLITDGVGDPLGDATGPVGRFLAAKWSRPPLALEFAAQVDFARRSHDDDRTAVAVWPGPEPVMEEVVPVARLGRLGELLGAGGQGRVFDAPNLRLPDAPGSLVYKEYKSVPQSGYGLRKLVKIRNGLDPEARRKLDQRTAWPVRVVEDADRVCGVIMPRIPDSYLQTRMLPGTGKIEDGIREVQNLLIPPARALRVGMPVPTPTERLMICRDFAAALHLVHKNDLVVGDLSARNGLYRLDERPSVMLVDCDAIRVRGTMAAMAS